MAVLRLFIVRASATRSCVAASFPARSAALPPVLRRAFTQSSSRPFPYQTPRPTDGQTPAATPKPAPAPAITPTPDVTAASKRKSKAKAKPAPTITPTPEASTAPEDALTPKDTLTPGATPTKSAIPELLLLYSPGQARIVYVAFWKITSLLLGTTCVTSAVLAYAQGNLDLSILGIAFTGWVPFIFMNYISRPFVTYLFMRLPPAARSSRQHLERFIHSRPPADTKLRIMTLGLVVKPRVTDVTLEELKPVEKRIGLVDYTRDVKKAMDTRKWYEYFPISDFGISGDSHKTVKDAWAWDVIRPLLGKSTRDRTTPWKPLE